MSSIFQWLEIFKITYKALYNIYKLAVIVVYNFFALFSPFKFLPVLTNNILLISRVLMHGQVLIKRKQKN